MQQEGIQEGRPAEHDGKGMARALLRLARPSHWLKNSVILAPLVYSRSLGDPDRVALATAAFAAFCLVSSAVYVLNDIVDRRADAEHPEKRHRPLASGSVTVGAALLQMAFLLAGATGLLLLLPLSALVPIVAYLLLNLGYSLGLKHVVLIDIFIIVAGFMLRIVAGANAIDVHVSDWLAICTLFLALFLAIAKRRSELNNRERGASRRVLDDYTPELVRLIMTVSVAGTILGYALFTVSEQTVARFGTHALLYTVPLVMYAIFRYLHLDERQKTAENPVSIMVRDPALLVTGALFAGISVWIIYGIR